MPEQLLLEASAIASPPMACAVRGSAKRIRNYHASFPVRRHASKMVVDLDMHRGVWRGHSACCASLKMLGL